MLYGNMILRHNLERLSSYNQGVRLTMLTHGENILRSTTAARSSRLTQLSRSRSDQTRRTEKTGDGRGVKNSIEMQVMRTYKLSRIAAEDPDYSTAQRIPRICAKHESDTARKLVESCVPLSRNGISIVWRIGESPRRTVSVRDPSSNPLLPPGIKNAAAAMVT